MAVYLRNYQLIPLERTKQLFKDLFAIDISEGTLVNMTTRCANQLSEFMEIIKSKLIDEKIIHNDETGINIMKKLYWLHTTGNQQYTYLKFHEKRGKEAIDEIGILPFFKGISIHDFLSAYLKYECKHSFCNAHIIRELIFIIETKKQEWASDMIKLLLNIKENVDNSKESCLEKDKIIDYRKKYNLIIQKGYKINPAPKKTGKRGRPKRGKILSLIDRMLNYEEEILRFMIESKVPFDNTLAERDLRMVKVRQKISGTFRNIYRAEDYFRIRSYISTIKKLKKDVYKASLIMSQTKD